MAKGKATRTGKGDAQPVTGWKAKSYRLMPPDEIMNDPEKLKKWRPEKLSVRQGIAETPAPLLYGYILLIVGLAIVCVRAYLKLPELVEVWQWFGTSTAVYNKTVFLVIAYAIQLFFIYRDLTRRSLSRYLFLLPALYFFLAVFLITSL